eukprot:2806673-Alexandrium_andersonii.AAC.1
MVPTVMILLVRRPMWAQTRSPELSSDPFRVVIRAERESGNENLARARLGSVLCAVLRAWRRG